MICSKCGMDYDPNVAITGTVGGEAYVHICMNCRNFELMKEIEILKKTIQKIEGILKKLREDQKDGMDKNVRYL